MDISSKRTNGSRRDMAVRPLPSIPANTLLTSLVLLEEAVIDWSNLSAVPIPSPAAKVIVATPIASGSKDVVE